MTYEMTSEEKAINDANNDAYIALFDVEEAQAGLARAMGRRRHARQIVTRDASKSNAR